MAIDRVIRGAKEVVSVPLSADLMLPETSGVPCVSVPILLSVGEDTGSRKLGPCPGVLKGVFTMVSSCLRNEGRTKDTGVAREMGSGVGPKGGVGNSRIRSAICSSGPVCTTSIRASGVGVRMLRDALSSSSSSLITSPTIDSTTTSLTGAGVPAWCVLGECGGSNLAGASSSWVGAEGPGRSGFVGVSVVASFLHPVRLRISPEISGRFSAATGGTSGSSPSNRTLISSRSSSILSAKSTKTGITFLAVTGCCARLASKSCALLTTSPVFPT